MQTDYVYDGAITELSKILKFENAKNILIFTGKNSFQPFKKIIEENLNGCNFQYYNNFSNNPKADEIEKALKTTDKNFDIIIAIGGGSVIDFAKCYKFSVDNNLSIKSYFQNKIIPNKITKMIAIPTTAGTGAEATQFAVVYLNGKKYSLDDISILPDYRIVDAKFVQNIPKYQKASCAADAFCQAIESYWAVNSNAKSKLYAKRAIELCRDYLELYVNSDNHLYAEKMSEASYLSGCAINISRTTAAHAISYPFTSKFSIPHGHAVALSIGKLAIYNFKNITKENVNDKRGIAYVKSTMEEIFGILGTSKIELYFENLFKNIGLETNFNKLGITNYDEIINSVDLERLSNNPIKLSKEFFIELFSQ